MNQLQNQSTKILVTGGAGFIGSHLTDKLLECGYQVTVLDNLRNGTLNNLKEAKSKQNFTFLEGDILDQSICNKAAADVDIIYHLACLGVRHSIHSPFENHRVNAEGTLNVLEAARRNQVKKFFYISTSEIYGDIKEFPISEEGVPLPKTVYGASKLAGENYTYAYHKCYGLNCTILRIFNNYGPRAHYEGDAGEIIPRSIVNMLYGKNPVIFGEGNITRDFFYVKDTASVLSQLIDLDHINGQIINIGTGVEISMKDLLNELIHLINTNLKIEFLSDRPADVPRLWVNNSKFLSILNFKPSVSFQEGLLETIQYYKDLSATKNLLTEIPLLNWEQEKSHK
jgi:UDP-glucose 4-epimerase